MNLTELLKKAATRGGIPVTDEAFTEFLANVPEMEVPANIATGITSLMSEADAKLNPEVKSYFTRAALDTVDKKVAEMAAEFGLSAEQVDTLKAEKSTYSKQDLLKTYLADQLKNAGKKSDSPEAKKIIEELEGKLQSLATEKANELQKMQADFEKERTDSAVLSQFNTYQWSDAYAPNLRPTVINAVLQQELAAAGAKIKRGENGQIELVNANDETLPFRLNNDPVNFNQFADGLMAKHNFIKTTPAAGSTPPATSTTTAAPSGQATQSNYLNSLVQKNSQLLAESVKQ